MKTCIALMAVLAISLFAGTSSVSALIIDHFVDSPTFSLTVTDTDPPASQGFEALTNATTTDLVNCMRRETLTRQGVFADGLQARAVHTPTASHFVSHSDDVGVESTLLMEYMFDSTDFTSGGGVGSLFVLFGAQDLSGQTITVTVKDSVAGSSSLSKAVPVGASNIVFDFVDFVGTADFTDVTKANFLMDQVPSGDSQIDAFETGTPTPPVIPEPLTMIGLCMGVGGLTHYIRRRRNH